MVEIEFHYQILKTKLKSELKETIKTAFDKSDFKYSINNKELCFIAHKKKLKPEQTIESIMTEEDKKNNKIEIFMIPLDVENNNLKEIICPECLEPCRLTIKDYKISLYHTSGMHNVENIKIKDIIKMQNDLLQKIKCKSCENKGKYKCSECNCFLCEKCKDSHKNHKIFNCEENKYVCNKHDQLFIKYCTQCDENMCTLCEPDHKKHFITSFEKINPGINEIFGNLRKLKHNIDIFNNNLKEIIQKLNKVIENMNILYDINENIINSYSDNYTNYGKILNIIDINNFINKELENLEEYEYGYNINKILYLYNEMESKNYDSEINYEFIPFDENEEEKIIPIFGDKFINNNLSKCKLIFNDYEYDLSRKFYSSDIYYDSDKFSVVIKGINNIINMGSMFEGCKEIKSLYGLKNLDTSKVINMKNMFYDCTNLVSLPDISKWNTSNVMNMEGLFYNNKALKKLPDISKWDTSKVISMMYLFYNCENLLSLPDISKWNISNNIDMRYMFCNCSNLITLPDISHWNTINVKYMTSLFKDCTLLISLPDISKWNTSNVISMNDLFQDCSLLTSIPDISKWNLSNVSDFSYSFMGCFSLTSLPDMSKWDLQKCKNLDGMFIDCLSLCSLPDFDKWMKYTINNKHSMFKRCFNSLNFPLIGYGE